MARKKLKDINKDGKRNFGDTWLGDLIGADGEPGVQGPGVKDSIKGARRGEEKPKPKTKPKAKSKAKPSSSAPKASTRPKVRKKTEITSRELSSTRGGRGDGSAEVRKRRGDEVIKKASRAIDRAESNKGKKGKKYTYEDWRKMSRAERSAAGLPVSEIGGQLEFNRFMEGITGQKTKVRGKSGYAKGGSVSRPRTGHTDHRKKGLFK